MLILTGYSTSGGYIGHAIQTQVQLNQANFDIIKSVKGVATASYLLEIGSSMQNITAQARKNMIKKADLNSSQALINITTDARR